MAIPRQQVLYVLGPPTYLNIWPNSLNIKAKTADLVVGNMIYIVNEICALESG